MSKKTQNRIRNENLALLARIMSDMQEVKMLENKRDWLRDRLVRLTRSISGMPTGGGGGGMDETFARISELEDRHNKDLDFLSREMEEAEEILRRIADRNMRVFVEMVYLMHMKPKEVTKEMCMTEWEYRQARQAVESAESMEKVRWTWPGNGE